jgi:hypothetical protein
LKVAGQKQVAAARPTFTSNDVGSDRRHARGERGHPRIADEISESWSLHSTAVRGVGGAIRLITTG